MTQALKRYYVLTDDKGTREAAQIFKRKMLASGTPEVARPDTFSESLWRMLSSTTKVEMAAIDMADKAVLQGVRDLMELYREQGAKVLKDSRNEELPILHGGLLVIFPPQAEEDIRSIPGVRMLNAMVIG